MRGARLSINILRKSQKTAHNMRTFEIPACGVCCLSEYSVGVAELMSQGKEIEMFRSPENLRQIAISLLERTDTIDELSNNAHFRVQGETYKTRAAEILQAVGL